MFCTSCHAAGVVGIHPTDMMVAIAMHIGHLACDHLFGEPAILAQRGGQTLATPYLMPLGLLLHSFIHVRIWATGNATAGSGRLIAYYPLQYMGLLAVVIHTPAVI